MYKTMICILGLIVIILVSGCTTNNPPAITESLNLSAEYDYQSPVWSPNGEKIAFIRNPLDSVEPISNWLYSINTKELTEIPFSGTFSWSPDGRSMFYSQEGDIWQYSLETGEKVNLTQNPSTESYRPLVSPNGNLILFRSEFDFWIMNADGNNARNLTENLNHKYSMFSWSNDSQKIVAVAYEPMSIVSIDLEGNLTTLHDEGITASVMGSPTSNQIAFDVLFEHYDIYLLDEELSLQNLTNTVDISESNPTWSSNGQYLAYRSVPFSDDGTYSEKLGIIDLNNGNSQQITDSVDCKVWFNFTWSADSERIAFECIDEQNTDIWVINRDGLNPINLTGS